MGACGGVESECGGEVGVGGLGGGVDGVPGDGVTHIIKK